MQLSQVHFFQLLKYLAKPSKKDIFFEIGNHCIIFLYLCSLGSWVAGSARVQNTKQMLFIAIDNNKKALAFSA